MASRKRLTTNTVFQAAETPIVEETLVVEETAVEEAVVEFASPAVQVNDDLSRRVDALEAKLGDLIAKLSRKMSL